MRDSFVFYRSFYEAINDLSKKGQNALFNAICRYVFYDKEPTLTGAASAVFKLIKPQIDANNKRFENGKRGGRPKNQNETETKPNENQNETEQQPNVNVNDNDNVNVILQKSEISESDTESCPTQKAESINYQKIVDYFNAETKGVFGTVLMPLSETRKGMIRARIKQHGKAAFAEVIRKAMESNFLQGQNSRNFRATFDWLIRPTNFEKVLSGNYDNHVDSNDRLHFSQHTGLPQADF